MSGAAPLFVGSRAAGTGQSLHRGCECGKRRRIQRIARALPVGGEFHESRLHQNLEMLGYRRLGKLELLYHLAAATRGPASQMLENADASGVRQRGKTDGEGLRISCGAARVQDWIVHRLSTIDDESVRRKLLHPATSQTYCCAALRACSGRVVAWPPIPLRSAASPSFDLSG